MLANLTLGLLQGGRPPLHPGPDRRLTAPVAVFLLGGPIAGAVLVVGGRSRYGATLVAMSVARGFAFEGLVHVVVPNSDHVAAVESGRRAFETTAALSTGADAVVLLIAVRVLSDLRSP